jgi:hypothetical protein
LGSTSESMRILFLRGFQGVVPWVSSVLRTTGVFLA